MIIETVKIKNNQIFNIEWHNQRFNSTRRELFKINSKINLEEYITPPTEKGVFRCRILYNEDILSIKYIPYEERLFKRFRIVKSSINYKYKYSDRIEIERLKAEALPCDEVIIEKDGFLTDTSIANIAFYDGNSWITPEKPILKGTMRANLLNNNQLIEENIKSEEVKHFSHFALMNAMIGFQIQKNIIIESEKEKLCL